MLTQSTHDIATSLSRRRWLAATAGLVLGLATFTSARAADDTIKVGVLHSLSGTMAISETTLKDTVLFMIDEQNKKGGVLGKKLEAVVVDPASNWPLFAEKARELITKDKVSVVFGCWTSVSRKSVLPVFKELNSILFYPVQYEGEESERNVFYTGAAPNQQAIPAVDYLMKEEKVKRWVLAGTDYVYPRTTNKILEAYLKSKGVAQEDIMINYTPFGHSDWQTIVADIKKFGSAGKKTAVVSTINGDANVPFYKELGNQGIKATDIPVVAFSVGEEELAGIDTKPLLGHLAAWNYFESIKTPANEKFIKDWQAYTKNPKRTTNDPDGSHLYRLQHVGEGGRKGEVGRCGQGDRRASRHQDRQSHRRHLGTASEPPHHQAGVHWRNQSQWPVRRGVEDARSGCRRCLVEGVAGFQGPDRRLGRQEVRQLQHQDQQMRWTGLLIQS
jgi:urea transport system substrate-binding protein